MCVDLTGWTHRQWLDRRRRQQLLRPVAGEHASSTWQWCGYGSVLTLPDNQRSNCSRPGADRTSDSSTRAAAREYSRTKVACVRHLRAVTSAFNSVG